MAGQTATAEAACGRGPVYRADGRGLFSGSEEDILSAMAGPSSEEAPLLEESSLSGTMSEAKKTTQYVGALAACMSAMAVGTTMGWTSAADELTDESKPFHISKDDFSWVAAFVSIGAIVGTIPLGYLANKIGRKKVIVGLAPFMTIGYIILACANSLWMLFLARFILGAVTGAYCAVAPMYTAEIAEASIRGILGSYFQLLITTGILFVYALNACNVGLLAVNIACACIPVILAVMVFRLPDTPSWFVSQGKFEGAEKSLKFFRGSDYDVSQELQEIKDNIEKQKGTQLSITQAFSTTAAKKGLFLALSVMLFQQFSGINAVIFYSSQIFEAAQAGLEASVSTVIVGVCQILATYVSTLIIDRAGRRPLLIFSGAVMALSGATLGLYFYLKEIGVTEKTPLGWLPIVCMVVFIIVFSLGYGPIPWLYMSELFTDQIKEAAMSIATVVNWISVFIVTKFYNDMEKGIGTYGAFWIFSGISVLGCVFTFFCVLETRGKSLSVIVAQLGGESTPYSNDSNKNISNIEKF